MAKTNPLGFIDFETGGLDCRIHPITEVAMVLIKGDTLETMVTYESYIKPYGIKMLTSAEKATMKPKDVLWQDDKTGLESIYCEQALTSTGITWRDIDKGKDLKVAVTEMNAVLKQANIHSSEQYRPILIAHNGSFDKGFMQQIMTLTKQMKAFTKLVYGDTDFYGNFQPEMIDSISFFKLWFGFDEDVPNWKLASCIARAGAELADGHRAINDTIGMKEAVAKGIRIMRSGIEGNESKGMKFRDGFHF